MSIETKFSPLYDEMQRGLTDAICIMSFANCISSDYEMVPYQVFDIGEAFTIFSGTDALDAPLLQGLMEVYTSGCRDIFLISIGSMDELPDKEERDSDFWDLLESKYTVALRLLEEVDDVDILIPYEADIEKKDFVQMFEDHCSEITGPLLRMTYFSYNGNSKASFEGEDIHTVLVDGEGLFAFRDVFPTAYKSGMASCFAGMVSNLDPNVPPDNRKLKCPTLFFSEYTGEEEELESNSIVGFRTTVGYERVRDGSLVSTLCFTRAKKNSDFKALFTVHLLQRFMRGIERLDLIGSGGYSAISSLNNYFNSWTSTGMVRGISASYQWRGHDLLVDLVIHMYYPIGELAFSVEIGPII